MRNIRLKAQRIKQAIKDLNPLKEKQMQLMNKPYKEKAPTKVSIPFLDYPGFIDYFISFCNSREQNGRVNGQHLLFVTGGQGIGKSTFIQNGLQNFRKLKELSPHQKHQPTFCILDTPEAYENIKRSKVVSNQYHLAITIDLGQNNGMLSETGLFQVFQDKIIDGIVKVCSDVNRDRGDIVLNAEIIKDVLLAAYQPEYLFILVRETVFNIINQTDPIFITNTGRLQQLQELNEQIIQQTASQFFQSPLYLQLIQLLTQQLKLGEVEATLRFFLSSFKRVEFEHRPAGYSNSWYETGMDTCTYLFQILDYLCGFGEYNRLIVQAYYTEKQSIQTKRETNQKGIEFISNGNHIDVVLVLQHMEKLTCYGSQRYNDWFDHILAKHHNTSNLRTRFPIVLELGSCVELEEVQNLGRLDVDNPCVMELPGYFHTTMQETNLPEVLENRIIDRLFKVLGRGVGEWNMAIRELASGTSIDDILAGTAPYLQARKQCVHARVNRMYLDPNNLPLLDNNTLQYHILTFLKAVDRCGGFMTAHRPYYDVIFYKNPIFRSLFQQGLFFRHYYHLAVDLTFHTDLFHLQSYTKALKRNNTLGYLYWRWFHNPYTYYIREMRWQQSREVEDNKANRHYTRRRDYQLRDYYYANTDNHRLLFYEMVLRQNYNV